MPIGTAHKINPQGNPQNHEGPGGKSPITQAGPSAQESRFQDFVGGNGLLEGNTHPVKTDQLPGQNRDRALTDAAAVETPKTEDPQTSA